VQARGAFGARPAERMITVPSQNVPENVDHDEFELAYLLITSRHIDRRGMDWLPYAVVVVALLMAFGALSLLGVL